MPKRYVPGDIKSIIDEIRNASPRAAISVSGSLLDYQLENVIRTSLRIPQNETEEAILFTDSGILGTFREKIWAAYFMNIIGPRRRRDLDIIRLIRNFVSHNMNPVSFETPEIASRCRDLEIPTLLQPYASELKLTDLREKFVTVVTILALSLHFRSLRLDRVPEPIELDESDLSRAPPMYYMVVLLKIMDNYLQFTTHLDA